MTCPCEPLSRSRAWWRWCTALACVRLPPAMAPLALVLAGRHAAGSFAFGGVLAAAHALAEAGLASPSGRVIDRAARSATVVLLALQTAALVALTACVLVGAPRGVLLALAAAGGGLAAGVPGALRAELGAIVAPAEVQRALGLDAVLIEVVWTAAPVVAAGLAALWAPEAALGAMALASAAAAVLAAASRPRVHERRAQAASGRRQRLDRRTWAVLLTSAAMGYAEGSLGVALPPRLEELGREPAAAGLLLALLSLSSIAGGLLFTRLQHRWRTDAERRPDVLLVLLAAGVLLAGQAPSFAALAGVLAVTGLVLAPLNATRSYAMELSAPPGRQIEAFSLMYAAMGGGWGMSGLGVGLLLGSVGPGGALTLAGLLALAAAFARGVPWARANSSGR